MFEIIISHILNSTPVSRPTLNTRDKDRRTMDMDDNLTVSMPTCTDRHMLVISLDDIFSTDHCLTPGPFLGVSSFPVVYIH